MWSKYHNNTDKGILVIANVVIRMTRGNKGESRIAFGKHKSVTSPSRVNHSWYRIETAFKCLFLDFGSDSLQFDNGSNYFQLGVIKFINIFSYFFFIPCMRGFTWLLNSINTAQIRFRALKRKYIWSDLWMKILSLIWWQMLVIFNFKS